MDKLSPDGTEVETQVRYAEYGFAAPPQRTRSDFAKLGAQVFGIGAGIATLIFAVARLLLDLRHFNLFHVFLFGYCAIPVSGVFGAIVAYRAYGYAAAKKVPSISVLAWIFLVLFLKLFTLLVYFNYSMRQNVLERDQRRLTSAVVYFVIAVLIALGSAGGGDFGMFVNIYSIIAMWCCCDTLLINMLRTYRNDGQLAPPSTKNFQYSLGTLFCVIFGSARGSRDL